MAAIDEKRLAEFQDAVRTAFENDLVKKATCADEVVITLRFPRDAADQSVQEAFALFMSETS